MTILKIVTIGNAVQNYHHHTKIIMAKVSECLCLLLLHA